MTSSKRWGASQGSLHGQFQRAVERGNVLQVVATARDLPPLSLSDSFALLLLFANDDRERFERAAPRWHARFVLAAGRLSIEESQALLGVLSLIGGPHRAAALDFLRRLCQEYGTRLDSADGHL
jgi:hypothetical protein